MNTTAPATTMFSTSMVVVNHPGSGGSGCHSSPRNPADEEHRQEGDEPANPRPHIAEDEGAHGRHEAPQADGAGSGEAAHEDHRDVRRQQDGQLLDAEQERRIAGPREDQQRTQRHREVEVRDQSAWRAQRQVQAPPHQRDRQDEDRDSDEQRLALAGLRIVRGIGADPLQPRQQPAHAPSIVGRWPLDRPAPISTGCLSLPLGTCGTRPGRWSFLRCRTSIGSLRMARRSMDSRQSAGDRW